MGHGVDDDADDDEDDALLASSGSRKRYPLHGAQKMLRETTTTYGIRMAPCWFGRGVELHKEQTNARRHGNRTGSFTQVRAAARRKTQLLLWWIDGETWWWCIVHFPSKGCFGAAATTCVCGCEWSKLLTP